MTAWKVPKRIPYLDGLRAYSIFAVVLGHSIRLINLFHYPWMEPVAILFGSGGLGVHIFFVLSGFLITTLLLKEQNKTSRISVSGFYERRIARIFPAFYTYFVFILVLVALHRLDISWKLLLAAATYTWNYGHWWWGVVTPDGSFTLGHLWSLSLEEQFYMVWPACLILFGRRGAKRWAIGAVALLPFVRFALYYLRPTDRGQLGMMFHTSCDSILWGALAAFLASEGAIDGLRNFRFRAWVPWTSGAAIFVLCPVLERINRGFGLVAVPSIQACAVVLFIFWLLSGEGGVARRLLETKPLVQLGLLSYSIYIWQEIFTLWDELPPLLSSVPARWICILVSSALSYYLVEVPLRRVIRQWFAQPVPVHD